MNLNNMTSSFSRLDREELEFKLETQRQISRQLYEQNIVQQKNMRLVINQICNKLNLSAKDKSEILNLIKPLPDIDWLGEEVMTRRIKEFLR